MRWMVALLLMTQVLHCTAIVNETIAFHRLNREIIYKVYTHDPGLLCASASVHGHMNKVQRPSLDVTAERRSIEFYTAGVPIFARMKVCYVSGPSVCLLRLVIFFYNRQITYLLDNFFLS